MQLLLCAATEMEIAPALGQLRNRNRNDVDVLITGIGMMAAAFQLTQQLLKNQYRCVLQAGVGGGLYQDMPPGKIFFIKSETIGDMGVEENGSFRSLFDLKLADADLSPWKDGELVNSHPLLKENLYPAVKGVTVNEISTSPQRIEYYRNVLQAAIESMEGAALHYVCLQHQVPFLEVRSISNFIGERDKRNWHLNSAIENLNQAILHLLEKI